MTEWGAPSRAVGAQGKKKEVTTGRSRISSTLSALFFSRRDAGCFSRPLAHMAGLFARDLTPAERAVVEARVAEQRAAYAAWLAREEARQVRERQGGGRACLCVASRGEMEWGECACLVCGVRASVSSGSGGRGRRRSACGRCPPNMPPLLPSPRSTPPKNQVSDLTEILPHLSTATARSLLASVGGDVSAAVAAAAEPAEVVRPPPPPPPTTPLPPRPAPAAHPSRPPPPAGRSIVPGPGRKPGLGRVKRCGSKAVTLLSLGTLHPAPGWHNGGYIFPCGYAAVTKFRSSVDLDATVDHECRVIGEGGAHWPAPTFVVVAADRPDEPLAARSATGAWAAVLARIGAAIEVARAGGANLPPPPRTQVAGPEYYGLTHPNVAPRIEDLDPDRMCTAYWAGKGQREAYVAQHGDARTPRGLGGDRAGGAAPAGARG